MADPTRRAILSLIALEAITPNATAAHFETSCQAVSPAPPMVGANGEKHWAVMQYQTVDPQKSFTGLDGFTNEAGHIQADMPRSEWKITFQTKGVHTLVIFQLQFTDLNQLEALIKLGFQEGLSVAMESLDGLLESGTSAR